MTVDVTANRQCLNSIGRDGTSGYVCPFHNGIALVQMQTVVNVFRLRISPISCPSSGERLSAELAVLVNPTNMCDNYSC